MADKIYIRGGLAANRPTLAPREPGFDTDEKRFFVGSSGGNIELISKLSGGAKIQSGTGTVTIPTAGTSATVIVTFPVAFKNPPKIFLSIMDVGGSAATYVNLLAPSSSTSINSFDVVANSGVSQGINFHWLAVGD